MKEVLYSTGMFEIGDNFFDDEGMWHTITDVMICHYLREGKFVVLYEIDDSGSYVKLRLHGDKEWDCGVKPKQKLQLHNGVNQHWRK